MFNLDFAYVSHICCMCMFQMFHLLHTYVAFKCFHVASVSHVSEIRSESHGGIVRVLGDGARRAEGLQKGRTAHRGLREG